MSALLLITISLFSAYLNKTSINNNDYQKVNNNIESGAYTIVKSQPNPDFKIEYGASITHYYRKDNIVAEDYLILNSFSERKYRVYYTTNNNVYYIKGTIQVFSKDKFSKDGNEDTGFKDYTDNEEYTVANGKIITYFLNGIDLSSKASKENDLIEDLAGLKAKNIIVK